MRGCDDQLRASEYSFVGNVCGVNG